MHRFLTSLLFLSLALPAFAGETRGPRESVKFGGEYRLRGEAFKGMRFDRTSALDEDDCWTSRILLNFQPVKPAEVNWNVQLGSASLFWSETVNTRTVPGRRQDRFFVEQAWLETGICKSPWRIRAGRQQLVFGDETLFEGGNWGIRAFWDAVRLTRETKRWTVDLFDAKGVGHDDKSLLEKALPIDITGIYATRKGGVFAPKGNLDLFVLANRNRTTTADTRTFGARFHGKTPAGIEYELELPVQTGDWGTKSHRAHALRAQVVKQFKRARLKPRLGYEYRIATGDDPATATRNEAFDTLYGSTHRHFGSMDYITSTNIRSHALLTRFFFSDRFDVDLNCFRFTLPEPSRGIPARRPAAGVVPSADLGSEVDLTLKYAWDKSTSVMAGVSAFAPGAFFRDTGRADAGRWAFLSLAKKF